jgi:hypothetical protein
MVNMLDAFAPNVVALWATTYTFEPDNFDEFLLRRLGEPPLNANILVDDERIQRVWDRWADQPWRFRRINREYLVRGVPWPGHAFHPKTYLFATKTGATLCVGSGNLTLRGVQRGNEVFCAFSSATAFGRQAIGTWRAWMERLVMRVDDNLLTQRWTSFVGGAPWLPPPSTHSSLLHNLDEAILPQLTRVAHDPVDELHVLAPFFDADCAALAALIDRLAPAMLHLYLPRAVSVHGPRLLALLGGTTCLVRLHGFDQEEFVHAKLIGTVSGRSGLLLSGSPNCSRPALLTAGADGNCEVAVVARTDADTVRSAFLPPSWSVVELDRDALGDLRLRVQPSSAASCPVRLHRARGMGDGRIEVGYEGPGCAAVATLGMAGGVLPLVRDRTVDPAPADAAIGVVWLCDADGQRISNALPVDHPAALSDMLALRAVDAEKPKEFLPSDLSTEVGDLIRRLSQECVFDFDELPAATGRMGPAGGNEQAEDEASAFWERFQEDQLRQDYRAAKYGPLGAWTGVPGGQIADELLAELRSMLDRTPETGLKLLPLDGDGKLRSSGPTHPQLQIRVGNVLMRWSRALADRRLLVLDPLSPVRNYVSLLGAIAECWERRFIGPDRLSAITLALLQSFVGSERRRGYLLTLEREQRERALTLLDQAGAPEVAAALVFMSLDPRSTWQSRVYEWQPTVVAALENGVVHGGEVAVRRLDRLRGPGSPVDERPRSLEPRDVDDHLERLALHTDDRHWSRMLAEDLGFAKLELLRTGGEPAKRFPWTVRVEGVHDLFADPRIVSVARQALTYKKVSGLIVEAATSGRKRPQRLSLRLQGAICGIDGDSNLDFGRVTSVSDLRAIEELGRGFEILSHERGADRGAA